MAWIDQHPDTLIERSEPAQALDWLRQTATLEAAALGKLDLFLHHWVLVLLLRPADAQGVLELMSVCQVARSRAAATPGAEAMGQRWQAFEDLLEGKRLMLRAAAAPPAVPLRHEATICQFITQQPHQQATQTALAQHLGLSAGRVSQILGVLEGRGRVTRQRQGQENWVRWVTPQSTAPAIHAEPAPQPARVASGSTGSTGHLGARVFKLPSTERVA